MSTVMVPSETRTPRSGLASRARHRAEQRAAQRARRRRLKRRDELSSRLAELHAIDALLGRAADVVRAGWVQGTWFTVSSDTGARAVTAYDLDVAVDRPVTGACLVGAVVHGAGGPATVGSQLVQRTLDLLRHALDEDPDRPVRWCPGPRLRALGVLELTYWNDAPGRTAGEVLGLLGAGRRTVEGEQARCRSEQAQLDTDRLSPAASSPAC